MSDHHFNPFVAKKYGIIEAILINSFIFWTRTNAAKEENYHDGRFWCYGTPQYFTKFFVYLSPKQIKYAFKKLIDSNALIIGNYNKRKYDKTAWYSLSDNILFELNLDKSCLHPLQTLMGQFCPMDGTKLSHGRDKIVPPIPIIKPDIKPDISFSPPAEASARISDSLKNNSEEKDWQYEKFEEFYSCYPIKKNRSHTINRWLRLNPSRELADKIIEDVKRRILQDSHWSEGFAEKPNNYLINKGWEDEILNRDEIKATAKKQQTKKIKEETEKRSKAQEEYSELERMKQIEKEKLIQEDCNAHKRIFNEVAKRGLGGCKDILGMR